jgi:hypothetical protein
MMKILVGELRGKPLFYVAAARSAEQMRAAWMKYIEERGVISKRPKLVRGP